MGNIVSSTDVPTILRTGNAYQSAQDAAASGQVMWMSIKRRMVVTCRVRPAPDFTAIMSKVVGKAGAA